MSSSKIIFIFFIFNSLINFFFNFIKLIMWIILKERKDEWTSLLEIIKKKINKLLDE